MRSELPSLPPSCLTLALPISMTPGLLPCFLKVPNIGVSLQLQLPYRGKYPLLLLNRSLLNYILN